MNEDTMNKRIARMLDIPKAIEDVSKRINALRAERRTLERKIESTEAAVRVAMMNSLDYGQAKNAEERNAVYRMKLDTSSDWVKHKDRMDSLVTGLEKHTSERDVLEHERKSLKAALEREYAAIIERCLTDEKLARAVSGSVRAEA